MLSSNAKRSYFFFFLVFFIFFAIYKIYASLIIPIGISLFLCFLLSPLVAKLEQYKIPRALSSFFLIILTLTVITVVSIKAVPYFYNELLYLVTMIPKALEIIDKNWIPNIREFMVSAKLIDEVGFEKMVAKFGDLSQISTQAYLALDTIWKTVPKLIGTVINMILIPMVTFFVLINIETLKKIMTTFIPYDLRSPITKCLNKMNQTIRSLLKGQVLVALIVGTLYTISFSIIGLESGVAIGIITGVGRLIPYVDLILGGVLSLIVVFSNFTSWTDLIPVLSIFLIVGSLDGMLIAPKILGRQTGLHPLTVILSLLAFANLYGFWGFVLAIPTIAILKDFVIFLMPYYYRSNFYKKKL